MPVDLTIVGADKFELLGKRLRAAGDTGKGLKKELYSGIQRAVKTLKKDMADAARAKLPKGGGLNDLMAGAKFAVTSRSSGRNVGVRLKVTKAGHDIRSVDRGRLRHPTYGHRPWVNQQVTPHIFTDAFEAGARPVRRAVVQVLDDVADTIVRGL